MIAAAGLFRYGHREHGAALLRAVLDAAGAFEDDRLPELFCGFERTSGPPVPYAEANTPQAWAAAAPVAWAAAAPVLATQILLGLVPDAPRDRCFVEPWLPDWLPELELRGIVIGPATVDIKLSRQNETTTIETSNAKGFDVIREQRPAPLWGRPGRADHVASA
jgi:glycogen debranching enzyme